MGTSSHLGADLVQMHLHGLGVGGWQHEGRAGAALWANGPKQIGIFVALISRQAWTSALLRPDTDLPVFLSQPGFILKPNFNTLSLCLRKAGYVGTEGLGEVFLKASMTRTSCLGCCGRPEI